MPKAELNSLPNSLAYQDDGAESSVSELALCFTKKQRLLSSKDFSRVFDTASIKVSHLNILVLGKENSLGIPRIGLVVAKKNVKLAVNRNKFKRLVRESFRLKQHQIPSIDAIVLARRGVDNLTDQELSKILSDLWKRVAKKAEKNRKSKVNMD